MTRAEIVAEFEAGGAVLDHGLAFRTDAEIEALYFEWRKRGAPSGVIVGVGGDGFLIAPSQPQPAGDLFADPQFNT